MATYQQWSQTYFVNDTSRDDIVTANLTPDQHNVNNQWFQSMLDKLTDNGILYVPCLDKSFNKLGEELWVLVTTNSMHKKMLILGKEFITFCLMILQQGINIVNKKY